MPYVTSFERFAEQRGLEKGRGLGMRDLTLRQLQLQIGALTDRVQKRLAKLSPEQVQQLGEALLKFKSKSDLTEWLKAQAANGHRTGKQNQAT